MDSAGDVLASPDATAIAGGGAGSGATWSSTLIDLAGEPSGVSCSAAGLCALVDSAGYTLDSDGPTAVPPSWSGGPIDTGQPRPASRAPRGVCAAVDGGGRVLVGLLPAPTAPRRERSPSRAGARPSRPPPIRRTPRWRLHLRIRHSRPPTAAPCPARACTKAALRRTSTPRSGPDGGHHLPLPGHTSPTRGSYSSPTGASRRLPPTSSNPTPRSPAPRRRAAPELPFGCHGERCQRSPTSGCATRPRSPERVPRATWSPARTPPTTSSAASRRAPKKAPGAPPARS